MAAARAAARGALRHCPPVRVGEEYREGSRCVFALAALAGDGHIGVFYRAQCIEASSAVQANVFVDRHGF
jgi:hypothetical protein